MFLIHLYQYHTHHNVITMLVSFRCWEWSTIGDAVICGGPSLLLYRLEVSWHTLWQQRAVYFLYVAGKMVMMKWSMSAWNTISYRSGQIINHKCMLHFTLLGFVSVSTSHFPPFWCSIRKKKHYNANTKSIICFLSLEPDSLMASLFHFSTSRLESESESSPVVGVLELSSDVWPSTVLVRLCVLVSVFFLFWCLAAAGI